MPAVVGRGHHDAHDRGRCRRRRAGRSARSRRRCRRSWRRARRSAATGRRRRSAACRSRCRRRRSASRRRRACRRSTGAVTLAGASAATTAVGALEAAATPADVGGGDERADRRVDVVGGQRVARAGLASDRRRSCCRRCRSAASGVEVERVGAGPGAVVERQRVAVGGRAGHRRDGGVGRRVGDDRGGRRGGGGGVAGDVGGGHLDAHGVADVVARQDVGALVRRPRSRLQLEPPASQRPTGSRR